MVTSEFEAGHPGSQAGKGRADDLELKSPQETLCLLSQLSPAALPPTSLHSPGSAFPQPSWPLTLVGSQDSSVS